MEAVCLNPNHPKATPPLYIGVVNFHLSKFGRIHCGVNKFKPHCVLPNFCTSKIHHHNETGGLGFSLRMCGKHCFFFRRGASKKISVSPFFCRGMTVSCPPPHQRHIFGTHPNPTPRPTDPPGAPAATPPPHAAVEPGSYGKVSALVFERQGAPSLPPPVVFLGWFGTPLPLLEAKGWRPPPPTPSSFSTEISLASKKLRGRVNPPPPMGPTRRRGGVSPPPSFYSISPDVVGPT